MFPSCGDSRAFRRGRQGDSSPLRPLAVKRREAASKDI
jgi:hypothetical protein